jgi:hypothetical protein
MDAFVAICDGWHNLVVADNSKEAKLYSHPFKPGERFISLFSPFTCTYISDISTRLHHDIAFETSSGIITMTLYKLARLHLKERWLHADAIRELPETFNVEGVLHFAETKNNIYKRGQQIGCIDSWEIDYIITEFRGNHDIIEICDNQRHYKAKSLMGVWGGSQEYVVFPRDEKITTSPLSPMIEDTNSEFSFSASEFSQSSYCSDNDSI